VVQLIHQSSANTAHVHLPRAAKTDTNYAERKVRSGDVVDSDGSKFSPDSEVSDEDQDKKPKACSLTNYPTHNQLCNTLPGTTREDKVASLDPLHLQAW
jgi:hypothetical protein